MTYSQWVAFWRERHSSEIPSALRALAAVIRPGWPVEANRALRAAADFLEIQVKEVKRR